MTQNNQNRQSAENSDKGADMDKAVNEYGYRELAATISGEIAEVLSLVSCEEVCELAEQIDQARRVFVFGVGRVFLALQIIARRLAHLGVDIQVVGSVTEKHLTNKDLLLIASGSGESVLPVQVSKLAKDNGAKLALITSARDSTIKSMADVVVHLPSPTKNEAKYGVRSIQSVTYLFDQSLHVFGDILCLMSQLKQGLRDEDVWRQHPNLE